MSQRISLDTLTGPKESNAGPFTPCAFAAGETAEAPACSTKLVLADCIERFESEAIRGVCDTGRYRMPYRVWGQGPALVLIPGLCDDAEAFPLPLARLSRQFCCIIYDLPTGRDDGARLGSHSHSGLVDDLFSLVDHLRLETAALLGVSFGSTIALSAMARDPRRFPTGILQGGFAHRPLAWTEVLLARLARHWPGTLVHLPLWRGILERYHSSQFAALEPTRWPFFLKHHGEAPIAAVAQRALMVHQIELRPLLSSIRQPVLLVCGEHDPLVGRACEQVLFKGLPNVLRAEIEGCGHLPQFTHPEVLCEVIEQFLQGEQGNKDSH